MGKVILTGVNFAETTRPGVQGKGEITDGLEHWAKGEVPPTPRALMITHFLKSHIY